MPNIEKLKKLKSFLENPQFALHQEAILNNEKLSEISTLLQKLLDKEMEMPETDMSKVETLLQEIKDKEEVIEVTLEIK